jgi:Family of unknown function (DUF6221)
MMPETARDDDTAATGCEVVRQRADALLAEFAGLMGDVAADRDRPDLARRMVTMTAALREVRAAVSGHALADELAGAIEARAEARGYARGLAAAPVPAQRRGRHAARSGAVLRLAPVVAVLALLRRSLGHHPAAAVKTALAAHKIAAAAGSVLAAGGTAAVVAVHVLGPSAVPPGIGSAAGPAPAATASASPIPSSSLIARTVVYPKPKHAARGKTTLLAAGASQPPWSPAPGPSSSLPGPSPSASSAAAGPAVLTVSTQAIDLTTATSAVITLSASGSGWASWKIDTQGQADLDFSATHGVLQAGQSVTITVSVDPAQASDGNTSETFTIGGVFVRADLPPLAPASSVTPSGGVTINPTSAPTALPSLQRATMRDVSSDEGIAAFWSARLDEREQWIRRFAQLLTEAHLQNADTPEHRHAAVAAVFGQQHLDPGMLLREVEADRKLLAAYRQAEQERPVTSWESDYTQALERAVQIRAERFSDHPDYRPEWKPASP